MDFTVVSSARAKHQLEHQEALCAGLQILGIPARKSFSESHVSTEYVACWGWRLGKLLRAKGHEVLVMERGYIGDRFAFTSLGWNGLNGHATFPDYPDDGGARFSFHGLKIRPWNTGGDYALIMGQVPSDASLDGKDLMPWYEQMAEEIKSAHGLSVHFRPHPDLKGKNIQQAVPGTISKKGTLQEALAGAAFSVCYNSNSSVDSILAGVPCVIGDAGSMAYEMCGKSVAEIIRPERAAWAHALAWKQWALAEIASGVSLRGLF